MADHSQWLEDNPDHPYRHAVMAAQTAYRYGDTSVFRPACCADDPAVTWDLSDLASKTAVGAVTVVEPQATDEEVRQLLADNEHLRAELQALRAAKEPPVIPSEALSCFMGWLTCRDEAVTFSRHHDAAGAAELVDAYCLMQGYEPPRHGIYPDNLKSMPSRRAESPPPGVKPALAGLTLDSAGCAPRVNDNG